MIFLQAGNNQVGFEENLKKNLVNKNSQFVFISESPIMKRIYEKIKTLACLSSPVLILGARGTGRTTAAYELFKRGKSCSLKQFIKFSCYGLETNKIEKKLFGNNNKEGLLRSGRDRTLFIKGVECFNLSLQKKLLSFLINHREKEIIPRLIFSSSERLSEKVKEAVFSQDLFEVLSQNLLILPSLSERPEDIPLLVSSFNNRNGFKGYMTEEALEILKPVFYKENIKGLKEACLQISILYPDKKFITGEDVSIIGKRDDTMRTIIKYNPNLSLEDIVNRYIQMSLDYFQSKQKSAKALGISVKTIYNKIKVGSVVLSDSE